MPNSAGSATANRLTAQQGDRAVAESASPSTSAERRRLRTIASTRDTGSRGRFGLAATARTASSSSAPASTSAAVAAASAARGRSEEHTSELQALMRTPYADFRLKKKNQQ